MKKSKFTEEQIAFALKQADAGTKVYVASPVTQKSLKSNRHIL